VRERRVAVVGDDDALAGGQAVGLHDVRGAVGVEGGFDLGAGRGPRRPTGGHVGGIHDPLRERLRALQLRRGRPGPNTGMPCSAGRRRPRDQRRLGADDHEVDVVVVGILGHRGGAVGIEGGDDRGVGGDAGVAGGREQVVARVLPFRARRMACSRAPEPRTRMRTRPAYRRAAASWCGLAWRHGPQDLHRRRS
jgi:hypothetical protein